MDDPFMAGQRRLPVNPLVIQVSHEQPSSARPFVLRGLAPTPGHVVEARHRTPASQRKIPQETNLDSKVVDDSYTVPDD